jgi:BASS family bile acid:Na+ symporter
MTKARLTTIGWAAGGVCLIANAVADAVSWKTGILVLLTTGALTVAASARWRGYAFTAWVFVSVGAALAFPQAFQAWWGYKLSGLIVPLIQIIMFGMGTTLSAKDFARVLLEPLPVFVGALLQFSVMPLLGLLVATVCGFNGELAAGVILIGSVSGGMASNVIAYIARANVALSVTMTAVSTLIAPLMTPLLMRVLAGRFVPIDTTAMLFSILNMILVPVVTGLLAHAVLYSRNAWSRSVPRLLAVAGAAGAVAAGLLCMPPAAWGACLPLRGGLALGCVLLALVALTKLVVDVLMRHPGAWMDRTLSLVSMSSICLILAVIIGQTYDVLIKAGFMLVVAAMLHNTAGYLVGYWAARGIGAGLGRLGYWIGLRDSPAPLISEIDCRTVSIETGMQNGGMATGLAIDVLHSHVAALPPNVFGAWMNVSGSLLANWWKRRPVNPQSPAM